MKSELLKMLAILILAITISSLIPGMLSGMINRIQDELYIGSLLFRLISFSSESRVPNAVNTESRIHVGIKVQEPSVYASKRLRV